MKEYAIYKGDKFLYVGTAKECAKYFKVRPNTVYTWCCKAYQDRSLENKSEKFRLNPRRKIAVVLEEE